MRAENRWSRGGARVRERPPGAGSDARQRLPGRQYYREPEDNSQHPTSAAGETLPRTVRGALRSLHAETRFRASQRDAYRPRRAASGEPAERRGRLLTPEEPEDHGLP